MKAIKTLITVVVCTVTLGMGMYAYYLVEGSLPIKDILRFGVLALLALFAIILGVRGVISEKRGQPAEDELSKLLRQKAAATAFYISLYFWLALSYIISTRNVEAESAIGGGIIGMAVIFALCWFILKIRGPKNA